ncbi:MAG TPA: hypothetical protein DCQ58_05255 [Saprospirales bacterium]|nr:hypothetical protein [Saprospirales bacterium]
MKEKLKKYASRLSGNISNDLEFNANFEIQNGQGKDYFHLKSLNGEMLLQDGISDHPSLIFSSRERTVMELLQLGDDLLDVLLAKPFYIRLDQIDLPEMDHSFFLSSETPTGWPVAYKLKVKDSVLHIWEGEEGKEDISIHIKPSILRDLIRGEVNIPFALIRGQIKVRNKKELFNFLKSFGLNLT